MKAVPNYRWKTGVQFLVWLGNLLFVTTSGLWYLLNVLSSRYQVQFSLELKRWEHECYNSRAAEVWNLSILEFEYTFVYVLSVPLLEGEYHR
jgi:hypothetical protein